MATPVAIALVAPFAQHGGFGMMRLGWGGGTSLRSAAGLQVGRRHRGIWLAAALAVSPHFAAPLLAQEGKVALQGGVPLMPGDPIARRAYEVLETQCARCHQTGKLTREKPAKGLGNILDLAAIAKNSKLIEPGKPDASLLLQVILKREMPYDVFQEQSGGTEPSRDDIEALRAWIGSLGRDARLACSGRGTVDAEKVRDAIATDLRAQASRDLRYVTLGHLHNACVPDAELDVYRQGVIKLLNSLSRKRAPVRLETIDDARTIIRFDLTVVGWEQAQWEKLVKDYPYAIDPDKQRFDKLRNTAGTRIPAVRADWLAFTASRPPHYHDLLKLPGKFDDLAKELAVNVADDIRRFTARRAGFQNSLVSRNNRVIERHPGGDGAFWMSYDFASNSGRQSLFDFPLGPRGQNAFKHDGGEAIFTLPNGLSAYYLFKANGDRINQGPTNIVQDPAQRDLAVTNGVSCMGCHNQGYRKATDELRAHAERNTSFPAETRRLVTALHPEPQELSRLIDGDIERFRAAMRRAGLDPDLSLAGVEMINALSRHYERDVTLKTAAAEFGFEEGELKARFEAGENEVARLERRIAEVAVPRDQFAALYKQVAAHVHSSEAGKRGRTWLEQEDRRWAAEVTERRQQAEARAEAQAKSAALAAEAAAAEAAAAKAKLEAETQALAASKVAALAAARPPASGTIEAAPSAGPPRDIPVKLIPILPGGTAVASVVAGTPAPLPTVTAGAGAFHLQVGA